MCRMSQIHWICRRKLTSYLSACLDQLKTSRTAIEIDTLEQHHQQLVYVASQENMLKDAINACDNKVLFFDCWKVWNNHFLFVEHFCVGLAIVSPGTSQVESNFSFIKVWLNFCSRASCMIGNWTCSIKFGSSTVLCWRMYRDPYLTVNKFVFEPWITFLCKNGQDLQMQKPLDD